MLEKKYNAIESEKKWQRYWEENKIYQYEAESEKEVYSIDTPPPTVNGKLHIGHIFSYTQAEMIARFHRMTGKNVFYPFGFDDNGLPTERLIEKEAGLKAMDIPRGEFIERCLSTTKKYEAEFKALWQSLGFSVDWNLQYETISPASQKISQASFLELYEKGLAYQKETPVLWCTNCRTSIAQAELEWKEKETHFNWISFSTGSQELSIATTRPELLYGCTALFVHPEDQRYQQFVGKKAIVPIFDYEIPILADEKVGIEIGTGIVMCATFGDTTDLEWFNEYQLPYRRVIEEDGSLCRDIPYIGGMGILEAREKTIMLLKEKGLLQKREKIQHTAAVHERCGQTVEIIPSKQWYIDIISHKERFLEAGNQIKWYPESMKNRYDTWVKNLKWDWCISRQRYFGVPIPVWYCKCCGAVLIPREEALPVNPIEDQPTSLCSCGCGEFIPEQAVLDTWATSSMTPFINSRWKTAEDNTQKLMPMSMRTQAHEIIRTWAFYSIVKSIYHTGDIPWKEIMICGFVMAKKGEKISKSKDNAETSPEGLIKKFSADAVRYWAVGTRLGTDTYYSAEEMQGSQRFLTKLWNAARFSLMHLQDYEKEASEELLPIDSWILEKLNSVELTAAELLRKYEIGAARHEIDTFFWNDFCDNYLEIIKDRLYKPEIHGDRERKSGQKALYQCMLGILKLYALYIPHMTEEIYQAYFMHKENISSIHQHQWQEKGHKADTPLCFGDAVAQILMETRKYKSERGWSLKENLKALSIKAPEEMINMLKQTEKDLYACTSADEIIIEAGEVLAIEIIGTEKMMD